MRVATIVATTVLSIGAVNVGLELVAGRPSARLAAAAFRGAALGSGYDRAAAEDFATQAYWADMSRTAGGALGRFSWAFALPALAVLLGSFELEEKRRRTIKCWFLAVAVVAPFLTAFSRPMAEPGAFGRSLRAAALLEAIWIAVLLGVAWLVRRWRRGRLAEPQ